ncbi:LOW QUALITY PROTEIN: uncharacterized protein [Argopecten irradians]|uniref:LOW QUALITY PROTEIN: uncharacterized protein n=1 Tax=Argopecten irradians TaxID=31199 RepID=UPI00371E84F8
MEYHRSVSTEPYGVSLPKLTGTVYDNKTSAEEMATNQLPVMKMEETELSSTGVTMNTGTEETVPLGLPHTDTGYEEPATFYNIPSVNITKQELDWESSDTNTEKTLEICQNMIPNMLDVDSANECNISLNSICLAQSPGSSLSEGLVSPAIKLCGGNKGLPRKKYRRRNKTHARVTPKKSKKKKTQEAFEFEFAYDTEYSSLESDSILDGANDTISGESTAYMLGTENINVGITLKSTKPQPTLPFKIARKRGRPKKVPATAESLFLSSASEDCDNITEQEQQQIIGFRVAGMDSSEPTGVVDMNSHQTNNNDVHVPAKKRKTDVKSSSVNVKLEQDVFVPESSTSSSTKPLQDQPKEFKANQKTKRKGKTRIGRPPVLGNFKCDRCDMVFRERQKMVKHRQKHVRPWIYCSYCDFKARCRESFMEHESKHTNTKPFKCELCPYASRSRIDLRRHQAKHSTVKNYKCPYCDFTTKWRRNVSHHLLSHVEDRPFHCEICGQNFKRSTDLKYHLYRHTSEKPLKCETCDFRCKTKYELDLHQLKHSDIRSFPCTYPGCVQACKTKSDLKKHMVVHCEERNYPCPLCGKYYKSASARNKHAKRHTNERPFKCDICNKGFKVKSSLGKHRVLHSGNKPYSCEVCGWTFSSKSNKDVHMKTHDLTDRPYRCPLCPHGAKSQHNLLAHVGTMHGNYAFFCELCQKPYKRHSQLQMHYKRMHSKMELEKLNSLETLDLTLIKGEFEEDESLDTNHNEEGQSAMNCILKQIKKENGEDELTTGSSDSLNKEFSSNAEKGKELSLEKRKRGRPKKKMSAKMSARQKSIDDQIKASETTTKKQPENIDDSSHIAEKQRTDQLENEISTIAMADTSPVTREETQSYPQKRKRGRPKKNGKTKSSSCKKTSQKRKNDCLNTDKSEERELEKEENGNTDQCEHPNFKNLEGVGVVACGDHQNVESRYLPNQSHCVESAGQCQKEPSIDKSEFGLSINKRPSVPAFSQKEVSSQKEDSIDNTKREQQISNSQREHLVGSVRQENEHSIIENDNEHSKVQSDNKVVKSQSECPIDLSQKEHLTGIIQTVKHSKDSEYEVTNHQNEHLVDFNEKEHSLSISQDGNQMLGHPISYSPYETPVDYSLNKHSSGSSPDEHAVDLSKKKQTFDNNQTEHPVDYSMKNYLMDVNQLKSQVNRRCEHPVDYSKKEHSTDMCQTEQPIKNNQMKQPAGNCKFEHSVKPTKNNQPSDNGQSEQSNNNIDQPDEAIDISQSDHLAANSRSDQNSDISIRDQSVDVSQSNVPVDVSRSDHPVLSIQKQQSNNNSQSNNNQSEPTNSSQSERPTDNNQSKPTNSSQSELLTDNNQSEPTNSSQSERPVDNIQREPTNSSQSERPVDNNLSEPTNSSQSERLTDNNQSEPTNSSQCERPVDNNLSEPTNSSQSDRPVDNIQREPTNSSQSERLADNNQNESTYTIQSERPADNNQREQTNSSQSERLADNNQSEQTNSSQKERPADNIQREQTNSSQSERLADNNQSEQTNSSQSERPVDNIQSEPTNNKSELESGNSQMEQNINDSQKEQNLIDYREEEHILDKCLNNDQVDNSPTKQSLITSQIDQVVHNNICEQPIDNSQREHHTHNTQSHCLMEYSQNNQKELSTDTSKSLIDSSQCEQPLDNSRGEQPMNVGQSEESVDNCHCEQVGNSKSEQPVNDEVEKRLASNQSKQLIDNSQCKQPVDYSKKENLSDFHKEQFTDCNQTDNGPNETSNGNSQMENSLDSDMTPNLPETSQSKEAKGNTQSGCSKDIIHTNSSENNTQTLPIESSNNHSPSICQSASEDPKEKSKRVYKCQIEPLKVIGQDENSRDYSKPLCSERPPEKAMPENVANDNPTTSDLNYIGALSVRCLDESQNGHLEDRSAEILPRTESDLERNIVNRRQESCEYRTNGSKSEQTLINTDCVSGNNADTNENCTENLDQENSQEKLLISNPDLSTIQEYGNKQDVRKENDNGIPVKSCISSECGEHRSNAKSGNLSEIASSDSRDKSADYDCERTTVLLSGDQELPSESQKTPVKKDQTRVNAISSHSSWTKFDGNFRLPLATRGFRFNFNKTGKKPKCWFMELDAIVDEESKKHQLKYLRRKSKIVSAGNFQRRRRTALSGRNEVSNFRMNSNKNAKHVNELSILSSKVEKSEESLSSNLVDRPHPSPLDGVKVSQEELFKLNKSEGTMLKPKLSIVSNELSESCMKKAKGISATKKRLLPFRKKFIKLELDSEGNCIKSDETYPLEDTEETAEKTLESEESLPKSGNDELSAGERAADCRTIDETAPKAIQEGSEKTDERKQYSVTKEAAHETTGNSVMNPGSEEDAEVVFSIPPKSGNLPTNDDKKQPGGSIKFKLYEKIKQRKVEPPSEVYKDLTTDGEIMNHSGYDGTLTKQRKEAFVNKESRQCIVCLRDLLYGRDPCKVEDWPKKLTCQSCEFAKKASSEFGNIPKNIYEKVDIGHINESKDGEVHVYVVKPPADKEIVRKSSNYSSAYGGYSPNRYPKADSAAGKIKTYVVSKETNKEVSYTLTSIKDNDEDNSDDRCRCGTSENLHHRTDSATLMDKTPDVMKMIYHPESFGCDDEPSDVKPNLETLEFQIQADNQEPSDSAIPFTTSSVGDYEVNDETDRTIPDNAKDSDHPYPLYVVNTGKSDGQEGSSEENITMTNEHLFRYLGTETSGEANSNNNSVEAWENFQGEGNGEHPEGTKLYVFCDDVAAKRTGRENLDQNPMALWNDPCVMTVVEDLGDDTRLVNGQTEYVEAEHYLGRKIKVEKEDVDSDIPDLVDDPDKVETRHAAASHLSDQDIKPIPIYHMSGAGTGYHTQQSTNIPDQSSQSSLPVILDVRSIKEEPDF